MKRDCYEVLGVPRHADEKAVKRAYRKLAKQYHPDTNAGDPNAEKRFQEVGEAYGILSDPEKKEIYDQYGWEAFENGMDPKAYRDARREWEARGGGQAWNSQNFGGGQTWNSQSYSGDPSEFFRHFSGGASARDGDGTTYRTWHFSGDPGAAGGFEDIFGDLFGKGGGGNSYSGGSYGGSGYSRRTAGDPYEGFHTYSGGYGTSYGSGFQERAESWDREAAISISFDEAVYGCTKTIRLSSQENQTGADTGSSGTSTLQVDIPAGIEDGKKLRLRGKGARRPEGGRGDLFLRVEVQEKPGFTRKGRDIYTEAEIPFVTAALGGETKLPTLQGQVLCRIPAGTQSGSKIRLKGKGVPAGKNGSAAGHEYVTIRIQVPKHLTPEEVKALRAFERAGGKEKKEGNAARTA